MQGFDITTSPRLQHAITRIRCSIHDNTYDFVVDTGANISSVTRGFCLKHDLPMVPILATQARGGGGVQEITHTTVLALTIGGCVVEYSAFISPGPLVLGTDVLEALETNIDVGNVVHFKAIGQVVPILPCAHKSKL